MSYRIIVIEDDVLVGIDLLEQLIEAGFDAVGPFNNMRDAFEDYEANGCDAAVLDVNLGKETSEAFAEALRASGTPFVILSGYSREQHPQVLLGEKAMSKPVHMPALLRLLNDMLEGPRRSSFG